LRRKTLSVISITFIFYPHFGNRAAIAPEKPRETRRKPGVEKIRSGTYAPALKNRSFFTMIICTWLFG
jgi:hypothetical protein